MKSPLVITRADKAFAARCNKPGPGLPHDGGYIWGRFTRRDGLGIDVAREHYERLIDEFNEAGGKSLRVLVTREWVEIIGPYKRNATPREAVMRPFKLIACGTPLPDRGQTVGISNQRVQASRQRRTHGGAAQRRLG